MNKIIKFLLDSPFALVVIALAALLSHVIGRIVDWHIFMWFVPLSIIVICVGTILVDQCKRD